MRPAAILVVAALVLAGCSLFGDWPFPEDISGGDVYVGEDAATIVVTTEQIGCCYAEGSRRIARLDGPTFFDWAVDDGFSGGEPRPDGSFVVGVQRHSVMPGDYVFTAWEHVCSGNCGMLDEPMNHCTLEFNAGPGERVEIHVRFAIPEPCVATVT